MGTSCSTGKWPSSAAQRRISRQQPPGKRAAFHCQCLPSALDALSKRSGWSRIRLKTGASLGHQCSDVLSTLALMLRKPPDACVSTPAPCLALAWLHRGLRYLRRNRDVQVPSSSPTPTKAGMRQKPAATWRRKPEQRVPTAMEINSRNKGGGRKTGPVLPCQAPSSSQSQAAKPQLRSRACPNILLRSWMQPTAKAQSPIWTPPAPASSTAYTHIGFCCLILLPPSSLHHSPTSYTEVTLQEHDQ